MNNTITVKNILIDQYFKLNLTNLTMTHFCTIDELETAYFNNPFPVYKFRHEYLFHINGTLLSIYIKTNHPELLI
jgi:hypothetical protein